MNYRYLLIILYFTACQTPISEPLSLPSTEEFTVADSLAISVVTTESLLSNPVVMQFDLTGRIWIVETSNYTHNTKGKNENISGGRVVVLMDENKDGLYETRHVFLDNLVAPRSIAHVYNGLLYADDTKLFFTEITPDLQPKNTVLVDSLYAVGSNMGHRPNSLLYHLDNWIYSAKFNARYRRKNGQWQKEATMMRGQWGITNDDAGRLIYTNNSTSLLGDYIAPNRLITSTFQDLKYNLKQELTSDSDIFPVQSMMINQNDMDREGALKNKQRDFSSTRSPLIYRATHLFTDYYGDAFVCIPEFNLIKRYQLTTNSEGLPFAKMVYDSTAWLSSKDLAFCPVDLKHGLDGAIYVLDLRDLDLENDLEAIKNNGYIYRIYQSTKKETLYLDLTQMPLSFFLGWLQHPSGFYRQLAQQQLVFNGDRQLLHPLTQIVTDPRNPSAQIQALWTLEGLDLLRYEHLERMVGSEDVNLLRQAIQLSERFPTTDFSKLYQYASTFTNDIPLQTELAYVLGKRSEPTAQKLWNDLAKKYANQVQIAEALVSGKAENIAKLKSDIDLSQTDSLALFISKTAANRQANFVPSPHF